MVIDSVLSIMWIETDIVLTDFVSNFIDKLTFSIRALFVVATYFFIHQLSKKKFSRISHTLLICSTVICIGLALLINCFANVILAFAVQYTLALLPEYQQMIHLIRKNRFNFTPHEDQHWLYSLDKILLNRFTLINAYSIMLHDVFMRGMFSRSLTTL